MEYAHSNPAVHLEQLTQIYALPARLIALKNTSR